MAIKREGNTQSDNKIIASKKVHKNDSTRALIFFLYFFQ